MLLMMYNESLEMESMEVKTRRSEIWYTRMILYAQYSDKTLVFIIVLLYRGFLIYFNFSLTVLAELI